MLILHKTNVVTSHLNRLDKTFLIISFLLNLDEKSLYMVLLKNKKTS